MSRESAWCRWIRTDELIKTPFFSRRFLHLLISYTVLSKECSFRLSDNPHVDKINILARANRRLTIRELAEECGISVGSCYEILSAKLKMHRVAATLEPRLMTDDQKANRVRVCQGLLERSDEEENFLSRITSTQNFTAIRCSFRLTILQSTNEKTLFT